VLSGLLDTIKGQFTSKSYWLGSMIPLLLFLFANGVMINRHSTHATAVAAWLTRVEDLKTTALQYSLLLGLVLAVAYLLSMMSSALLELLEGKHVGPLRGLLYAEQWRRLANLDRAYRTSIDEIAAVESARAKWEARLSAARKLGAGKPAMPVITWNVPVRPHVYARVRVAQIRFLRRHGYRIPADVLGKAIARVAEQLELHDAAGKMNRTLDAAQKDLVAAIQYAIDRGQFERIRLLNERTFNFPGTRASAPDAEDAPATNSVLAPTRMGNIGRTMRSYALVTYQLDLDIFWTRLLGVLQKEGGEFLKSLQDTKAQVDCAVTLVWLSAAFTVSWVLALLYVFPDATEREFQVVGLAGTLVTVGCYWLACQSYRAFADVLRSSIDLFRHKVLETLRLTPPYGLDEERELWRQLGNTIGYGGRESFVFKHK
jgi:hypothetical protein